MCGGAPIDILVWPLSWLHYTHKILLKIHQPTRNIYIYIVFPVHRAHRVVVYTPSRAYTFPTYNFIYIRNSQRKCIRTTLAKYIHIIYEHTLGAHVAAASTCTRMFLLAKYRFPRPPIFDDEHNSNPYYWPPSKLPPNKPHHRPLTFSTNSLLFYAMRVLRPLCAPSPVTVVVVVIVAASFIGNTLLLFLRLMCVARSPNAFTI